MTVKRMRGRPKGTTIPDGKYLDAVADLIVRNPGLKKTPAIGKIIQNNFPQTKWASSERRLLRKWNETSESRMRDAHERKYETQYVHSDAGRFASTNSGYMGLIDAASPTGLRAATERIDAARRAAGIFDQSYVQALVSQLSGTSTLSALHILQQESTMASYLRQEEVMASYLKQAKAMEAVKRNLDMLQTPALDAIIRLQRLGL
jgi:hypothetical protein